MKLLTINSRGFDSAKEKLIFDSFFDVCFIQEVQISDPVFFQSLSRRWSGHLFWSPAIGRQGGVITLLSDNFNCNVLSWRRDSSGRVITLLLDFNGVKCNLINIYAPTNLTDRKTFFENIHHFFLPDDFTILGGDFNCYERDLDKFGGNVSLAQYLTDFRSSLHFIDAWRKLHPRSRDVSWFNSNFSVGSRLDKFFVSRNLRNNIISSSIFPCCLSDHDFVNLHVRFDNIIHRGPGLWKFNSSLLQDSAFCDLVKSRIVDLSSVADLFSDIKDWWEFFRSSLPAEIIAFSKDKRRRSSRERVLITNRLIVLKQRLASGEDNLSFEISLLESDLKTLTLNDLEGCKIRSRVRWLEEGEKPTRFFLHLERERIDRNSVSSILNSNGDEVFARAEIERAHVDFYTTLFSEEPINHECKQRCLASILNVLSCEQQDSCEGFLTLDELSFSVRSLNLGKLPGSDGFSTEFYLFFWDLLAPLLLRVANSCYRGGELVNSMKGSVTRLIYKKRGDIKDLKNWRPISLLNVDYKIVSKAITVRLSKVLEHVVGPAQTCSVPGRSILANTFLLQDTLDYIERTNEPAILLSLDQEKAFDRVDRSFLLELLPSLGFGPSFCRWVTTLYSGANMRIILNDWLTPQIPLERGVRQGDPLSPLLYVLCVEILANLIRTCPQIEGFLLPGSSGCQAKVRLYADDTTTILKDFRSLTRLFDCVSIYERGTGAKLNKSKTEAMWLGAWKSHTDEPLGLTWVHKMKILGIVFGSIPTLAGLAGTLDSPGDSSFFLCKYFVGRRLSSLRPCWFFLRDNCA